MLPKLFVRDWILNRRVVLLNFAVFGAFQVYSLMRVDSSRAWLVFATIYASFLAVTIFIREDRFGATGWTCTLPVTRRKLVLARYLESWVMVLLALGATTLLAAVLPGSVVHPAEVLRPSTLLIAATIATLVLSLMQPFTIRFGFLGVMIFLVGMQVLGVALLTVLLVLRGSGRGRPVVDAFSSLGDALIAVREALSPTSFVLLLLVTLILTNWLGYRSAVFLFGRREL
jgi:ABC-type transport system involved in multi-copper enzyme maturation permease subunit